MRTSKDRFLHAQLKAVAEIWPEIEKTTLASDRWLGNYFHRYRKKFGSCDRRFIAETIYALFRHKTFLQSWAASVHHAPTQELLILMAAAAEHLIAKETFVAMLPGSLRPNEDPSLIYQALQDRFLPLNTKTDSIEASLALRFSFPGWLLARWLKRFGRAECQALLAALQDRPPLTIRVNNLKVDREKLMCRLESHGLKVAPTTQSNFGLTLKERVNLFDSEEFRQGFFEVQDEGSQIVCQHVCPKPGETIWDVCAGGGGKSLFLAALMQNKGRIIATDIRPKKLEDLKKRAARAGAHNIFPADLNRLSEIREMKKGVDKILVDAPCSGTGTLRRNPDAKWKLREENFALYHRDQVAIIEKAIAYLKPGGKIYYVTCSLESEENEEVMREVFSRHPQLSPVGFEQTTDGFLRLLPHRDHTDGFFLAVAENKKKSLEAGMSC